MLLTARKEVFKVQRHNEIRDTIYSLASLVWSQVTKEPTICSLMDDENVHLIGFVAIRGVWQPQATAFFDIHVVDTDAKSYGSLSPRLFWPMLNVKKKSKSTLMLVSCNTRHVSFTPLCFSVDGLVGKEAKVFLDLMADRLALKWSKPYSCVVHWLRCKNELCFNKSNRSVCTWNSEYWNVLDGAIINPSEFHD